PTRPSARRASARSTARAASRAWCRSRCGSCSECGALRSTFEFTNAPRRDEPGGVRQRKRSAPRPEREVGRTYSPRQHRAVTSARRTLLLLVLGPALLFCCARSRPAVRNVLLISIDTLRADHLGAYGFPRPTTPNIDAVAREGVLFKNVHTPVPMTLP